MFPKVAQIVEITVLTYNDPFQSSPKSHQYFWATFITKFVTLNFKKSPNLVTLCTYLRCSYLSNTTFSSNYYLDDYGANSRILSRNYDRNLWIDLSKLRPNLLKPFVSSRVTHNWIFFNQNIKVRRCLFLKILG